MFKLLKNKRGYTLTELIVVMAVMAVIMTLSISSYYISRKSTYMGYVANRLQTTIREGFTDTLSTKTESSGACDGKPIKLKVIRIQTGDGTNNVVSRNPISIIPYCEVSGVLTEGTVKTLDLSESLNYAQDIQIEGKYTLTNDLGTKITGYCRGANSDALGYLYLIYTSPYGKFYSYCMFGSKTSPSADESAFLSKFTGGTPEWEKTPKTQEYVPKSSPKYYPNSLEINFDSNTSISGGQGLVRSVFISEEGGVELK